jgi:hypothetical protein
VSPLPLGPLVAIERDGAALHALVARRRQRDGAASPGEDGRDSDSFDAKRSLAADVLMGPPVPWMNVADVSAEEKPRRPWFVEAGSVPDARCSSFRLRCG